MKAKSVKVSEKGQIAIPKEIRQLMDIEKGDELLLIADGNKIIIEKIQAENYNDLLKLSKKVAKRIWDNEEDEIWNDL